MLQIAVSPRYLLAHLLEELKILEAFVCRHLVLGLAFFVYDHLCRFAIWLFRRCGSSVVLLVSRDTPSFDGVMLSCAVVCGAVCLRLVLGRWHVSLARSRRRMEQLGNARLREVRVRDWYGEGTRPGRGCGGGRGG